MAGPKIMRSYITSEDGITYDGGTPICGYPMVTIIENGNVKPDDEWALYRLTDDGVYAHFEVGCEMAAGIMGLVINGERVVKEIARFKTEAEAVDTFNNLSPEEQHRTLLRSVRPKS